MIDRIKNEYGLTDRNIEPLLSKLLFKSESTQETYLIFFKKWLEAGGVFDDDTAIAVLKRESSNSIKTAYYALRFIYRCYDEELGFRVSDVAPKSVRRHKEVLSPSEIRQIIRHVKNNEKATVRLYFVLATVYGLRRIEMFRLEKVDIDLGNKKFFVFTAKGGEPREHIIPDFLLIHFRDFKKEHRRKYKHVQELNVVFDAAVDRAGIKLRPRLGWHSVRRCLVTELMKTAVNPMIVRHFLRWKPRSSDILMEYTLYNPEEVDRTIFEVHPFLKEWVLET